MYIREEHFAEMIDLLIEKDKAKLEDIDIKQIHMIKWYEDGRAYIGIGDDVILTEVENVDQHLALITSWL